MRPFIYWALVDGGWLNASEPDPIGKWRGYTSAWLTSVALWLMAEEALGDAP